MSIRRFVGYHGVGYPVQSDVPSLERHLNDLTVAVDRSRSDTYDNLTVANCTAPAGAPCPACCRQVWHADRVGEAKGGAYVDAFPYDCRLRPWYQGALRSGWPLWTPPYVFATSNTIGMTAAMTLRDYYGSPVGALGIDVSFEEISRYLALNAAVFDERNMTLFVFDRLHGDKLIASSKGNFVEAGEGLRRPDACGDAVVERAYASVLWPGRFFRDFWWGKRRKTVTNTFGRPTPRWATRRCRGTATSPSSTTSSSTARASSTGAPSASTGPWSRRTPSAACPAPTRT